MFTGIIEECGTVKSIEKKANSARITILAKTVLDHTQIGQSIAVNGICLTVTSCSGDSFTADVMPETMNRSSLSILKTGSKVNLERAMLANGRLDGHIVSGHIDGIGKIVNIKPDENAFRIRISADPHILEQIVEKGSITIDGISLTVSAVDDNSFEVSIIPHTAKITTLYNKKVNDPVNLETDLIGKYVFRFLQAGSTDHKSQKSQTSGITQEFLLSHGFGY